MITDQQVVLLRQKLMEGKTQQGAAASAAMSERSARKWQRGSLPSESKRSRRRWRSRPDPFADVWDSDAVPLLLTDPDGELSATTILEWLDERYPGRFGSSQLRTLQRRIRDYRTLHGPDREVYFQQDHPPGREAQVDRALKRLFESGLSFDYAMVRRLSAPAPPPVPDLKLLGTVDLGVYDRLLVGGAR